MEGLAIRLAYCTPPSSAAPLSLRAVLGRDRVTLFITSVNAITLPRLMWMGLRDNIDPASAALSVILIIITVLVLALRSFVVRLRGVR